LLSLDRQGRLLKKSDARILSPVSLLKEIETLYDERNEEEVAAAAMPRVSLNYPDPTILVDANDLLIHHVRRHTGIRREDKRKLEVNEMCPAFHGIVVCLVYGLQRVVF